MPTVVYGYFALLFVTPFLRRSSPACRLQHAGARPGHGHHDHPYVASLSEDAMRAVPIAPARGAYATGRRRAADDVRSSCRRASPASPPPTSWASRAPSARPWSSPSRRPAPEPDARPPRAAETITAYIVQVSLGDLPHGCIGYQTIFAVGLTLFVITLCSTLSASGCAGGSASRAELSHRDDTASAADRPCAADRPPANMLERSSRRSAGSWCSRPADARAAARTCGIDGIGRINWDFLTSFLVAGARAGILSAWVGTTLSC